MLKSINFAKMWDFDLPQYAEAGYQRAQYFLGVACMERNSFHTVTDDPEQLKLAEKWLLLAIESNGIDPDGASPRGDRKKYQDMAKQALSRMYADIADKNAVSSGDRYNPQYNETGIRNVRKVLELDVNPYFASTVAMQYLNGGIKQLIEGQTPEQDRAYAISLLVNAAPVPNSDATWYLQEIAKETGALDVRAAEGHANVLKSYAHLAEHWDYKRIFDKGFGIIEEVGDHQKNGYEGYRLAKAVLSSLQQRAQEDSAAEEKGLQRAKKREKGLGGDFDKKSDGVGSKSEPSPLLQSIIKARQFIETSKMGSDADFDARPA